MFGSLLRRSCLRTSSSNQKVFFSTNNDLLYTKSHEWIKSVGPDCLKMGITDHAQRELGDISFVVLPIVGKKYDQDQEVVVIESTKAVGEIKMPMTGLISEVNQRLDQEAKLINDDPEGSGWIFSFKTDGSDGSSSFLSKLMSRKDYQDYLKTLKK